MTKLTAAFRNFANAPKNDDNGLCSQERIQRVHPYDRYTNEDEVSSQPLHGAVRRDRIARVNSALLKMCGNLKRLRADLRLPLTREIKNTDRFTRTG